MHWGARRPLLAAEQVTNLLASNTLLSTIMLCMSRTHILSHREERPMSAFKRPNRAPNVSEGSGASTRRASDGFATLTGDMMERRGATPPPLIDPPPDAPVSGSQVEAPKPLFGKRRTSKQVTDRSVPGQLPEHLSRDLNAATEPPISAHPCQTTAQSAQKVYAGPDRRKHHISPVLERRRSVPPRVKVSVRLEQYRHQRLKGAGVLLGRTHQDIITVALDKYLDALGVLKGEHR